MNGIPISSPCGCLFKRGRCHSIIIFSFFFVLQVLKKVTAFVPKKQATYPSIPRVVGTRRTRRFTMYMIDRGTRASPVQCNNQTFESNHVS